MPGNHQQGCPGCCICDPDCSEGEEIPTSYDVVIAGYDASCRLGGFGTSILPADPNGTYTVSGPVVTEGDNIGDDCCHWFSITPGFVLRNYNNTTCTAPPADNFNGSATINQSLWLTLSKCLPCGTSPTTFWLLNAYLVNDIGAGTHIFESTCEDDDGNPYPGAFVHCLSDLPTLINILPGGGTATFAPS